MGAGGARVQKHCRGSAWQLMQNCLESPTKENRGPMRQKKHLKNSTLVSTTCKGRTRQLELQRRGTRDDLHAGESRTCIRNTVCLTEQCLMPDARVKEWALCRDGTQLGERK